MTAPPAHEPRGDELDRAAAEPVTSTGPAAPPVTTKADPAGLIRPTGHPHPWRVSLLFMLPFLLLGLAWIGSNPPGAAPDEADHLVKAIGIAHWDIGEKYTGAPVNDSPVESRNASISRVVEVPSAIAPSAIAPDGLSCFAFQPTKTAACLPTDRPNDIGDVAWVTPVGAYPPYLYLLPGVAASTASTPVHAITAARVAVLLMSMLLLLVGAAQLVRWLGRPALIGAFAALTPMAIFTTAAVSTSGLEIMAAFGVAAVVIVAMRHPESLRAPSTHLTLAASGGALVLSRQLGVVTLGVLGLVMIATVGWRPMVELFRRPRPTFLVAVVILVASVAAIVLWELRYDHPSQVGPLFSEAAIVPFLDRSHFVVASGIGVFGWLDSPMPEWGITAWLMMLAIVVAGGFMFGRRKDRWSIFAVLVVTALTAYVTYASVFFPVGAGIQGRHLIPLFLFCPLLAGVVVTERLRNAGLTDVARRFFVGIALFAGLLQFVALYVNARRYAVGVNGPILFLNDAQWAPRFGWLPWLLLGAVATIALAVLIVYSRPKTIHAGEIKATKEAEYVER